MRLTPRKRERDMWSRLRVATLNVRGLASPGKWVEVEKWMKKKKVDVLLIQETKIGISQEVKRKYYTWYLSGDDSSSFTHFGVGIVIQWFTWQHACLEVVQWFVLGVFDWLEMQAHKVVLGRFG